MNTAVNYQNTSHSNHHYRQLEKTVFDRIPGMQELRNAGTEENFRLLQVKFPDAAFALMTAENLFCRDRELNAIHLKAYQAILNGEPVSHVRFRYDYDLELYLERHLWDD